jgi:UDP-2,3-diacylglucosamine pyrophosphatase LpxH
MTTLVISDLHLGSRSCQVGPIAQILETNYDRLILNGDTLNNLNLRKLKKKHWRLVDQLRSIARDRELTLIRGNHDVVPTDDGAGFGPMDVLASLLDVPLREESVIEAGSNRYLVLHGDRFDPTLTWPIVTDAADWCYRTVQGVNKRMAKWLKRGAKRWGGVVEYVKRRSVEYARNRGFQGVIAGHTHFCDDEWINGIHYLNSGSWVDWPCTFVVADERHVELRHWQGRFLPEKRGVETIRWNESVETTRMDNNFIRAACLSEPGS